MGHIVEPTTFVDVAIGMDHLAEAICLIVSPLTVIPAAILPKLHPLAVLAAVKHFTGVGSPILESNWRLYLQLSFAISNLIVKSHLLVMCIFQFCW
jgi:hypothetical protein